MIQKLEELRTNVLGLEIEIMKNRNTLKELRDTCIEHENSDSDERSVSKNNYVPF